MARDSAALRSDRELIEEMASRVRRTETKVTKVANHLGVDDIDFERPVYNAVENAVFVPSPKCTLEEVLAVIPKDRYMVAIYKGAELLMTATPA